MFKQKIKTVYFFIAFVALFFLFNACNSCRKRPFYEADISGIEIDSLRIFRYEEVLFNVNPFVLYEELVPHKEEFYFFLGEGIHDDENQQMLFDYVTDPLLIELYNDSREVWADTDELERSLENMFRYYRHHFPEGEIPAIYTYISGIDYNLPVILEGDTLIIAIDNYLGSDYHYYEKLGIPRYISQWMKPASVTADIVRIYAHKHLQDNSHRQENLLDNMITEGRKLYFLDCMIPHAHDSLKIFYTGSQLSWMENNEAFVWTYIIDNDLLYSTDHNAINKFTGRAPFTSVFSRHSAPQTGSWIGWQIVREYMRRNPELSLQDLMAETDAREILRESRYRP